MTFVGQPNEHSVQLPVGDSVFNIADLGVVKIEDLNNASYAVDK